MSLDTTATIFNIQKFSLHDGPGIRTVVFFKGCPLKCQWCANPESQLTKVQVSHDLDKCTSCRLCETVCPTKCYSFVDHCLAIDYQQCNGCCQCSKFCPNGAITIEGKTKTVAEIVDIVMQDKAFYKKSDGGVTFSGGEVLSQVDEAVVLAEELHNHGINIGVETSGLASPEDFAKLYNAVDFFLYDVKHWKDEKHFAGTGCHNDLILQNLKAALAGPKTILVRIPVIPGYNNSLSDAKGFADLFNTLGVTKVELLPFHQLGEKKYENLNIAYALKDAISLSHQDLEKFREILLANGIDEVLLQVNGILQTLCPLC